MNRDRYLPLAPVRVPRSHTPLDQRPADCTCLDAEFGADPGQRLPCLVQMDGVIDLLVSERLAADRDTGLTKHLDDAVLVEVVGGTDGGRGLARAVQTDNFRPDLVRQALIQLEWPSDLDGAIGAADSPTIRGDEAISAHFLE